MTRAPKSIDEYLASVCGPQRSALEALRRTICRVAPGAAECISYGMPAFRVDGVVIAGFAATTKGCSYYPFSGSTLDALAADVAKYRRTKGALHFGPGKSLPVDLVRRLVKARIAEIRR